jgi:hypothetical protein
MVISNITSLTTISWTASTDSYGSQYHIVYFFCNETFYGRTLSATAETSQGSTLPVELAISAAKPPLLRTVVEIA